MAAAFLGPPGCWATPRTAASAPLTAQGDEWTGQFSGWLDPANSASHLELAGGSAQPPTDPVMVIELPA